MSTYTGRFAPTPSGPLHQGSLLTALASYLDARAKQGTWLLRIDDLDTPRNQAGAADRILSSLDAHGLHWDAPVLYQSDRIEDYQSALLQLVRSGQIFSCQCSRKLLQGASTYPGTCSRQIISTEYFTALHNPAALRVKVNDSTLYFDDLIQGRFEGKLTRETGDFIVFRRDGIHGYHLTTAIDDSFQNISHIIRGADLLQSSLQQTHIINQLGLKQPIFGHIPVIVDNRGHKLSKHSKPESIDVTDPASNLYFCLARLGQNPPMELQYQTVTFVLQWGIDHWDINLIPGIRSFPHND